ncbi:MAG TPA: peptidase MA family metallohydrolase [Candidatus Omnitrophota bacterium]|nr:peptidase MA family metallohydrolase [Candidatus Omnitrophota bacterium]
MMLINSLMVARLFLIGALVFFPDVSWAVSWQEEKGKHFIIRTAGEDAEVWAKEVLRHAEDYYRTIAQEIDYPRYDDFWTWDERVSITVYPDKQTFLEATGQPEWSMGGAIHRPRHEHKRTIVTYKQEENFLDGLLPHEISHLMLIDYIGEKYPIPIWLNEGVAQLQEKDRRPKADILMRQLVTANQAIPFDELFETDIRQETETLRVAVFYSQSVSIVDFLITDYGSKKFGLLLRQLRDGKDFEEALGTTYATTVPSIEELEKKWVSYMKK